MSTTISTEGKDCLSKVWGLIKEDDMLQNIPWYFDDNFVLQFCKHRKFNVENSFKMIQNYIEIRFVKYSHVFVKAIPSKTFLLHAELANCLKSRDSLGRVVFYHKLSRWNLNTSTLDDLLTFSILFTEDIIRGYDSSANIETVVIMDMSGLSLSLLKFCRPSVFTILHDIMERYIPVKVKGLHYINLSKPFASALKLFAHLISDKIRKRIQFHSDLESLHKHLDKDKLPVSLGGEIEPDENAFDGDVIQRIIEREELYQNVAEFLDKRSPLAELETICKLKIANSPLTGSTLECNFSERALSLHLFERFSVHTPIQWGPTENIGNFYNNLKHVKKI